MQTFQESVTESLLLERWPQAAGVEMRLRLLVRGELPPKARGVTDVKHRIRQEIHPQLRNFWRQHPILKQGWEPIPKTGKSAVDTVADNFERYGFRWVPLVHLDDSACELDILILRRDEPFQLFSGTGDIDNRVKTLLDGLRMPAQKDELKGTLPSDDQNPFFVLLEDDRVVTSLNVTTDRLLVPPLDEEPYRDITAVISVRTKAVSGNPSPIWNIHHYE